MRLRGSKKNPTHGATEEALNPRWWTLTDEQLPGAVIETMENMRKLQTSLEYQRQVCARLYGGMTPNTLHGGVAGLHVINPSMSGRLTYNLIAIVVDTLVSKITKSRVRPYFLTQGGDYRLQRRAKKLSQFADGIFSECKFDELGPIIFRDGAVLGDGIIHVYPDTVTRRVKMERVLASELWVDEVDGFYGEPTQMHRAKNIDRQKLLEGFPDKADIINKCQGVDRSEIAGTFQHLNDTVGVVESWHLASGPNAKDGCHTIAIDSGVLYRDDSWNKTKFPFARFSWKPRIYGWHGSSLAEELIGTQVEMNHLLFMMQRAFRLMAAFKIVVESGTVPDQHFQDRVGTILHVPKGSMAPQYLAPPAVNPQYFTHFDAIKQRGFEIARLSQFSAMGEKPAGLDSGEAQRVYHDIEGEGFQYIGKRYEQLHIDVIELAIDVARDLNEEEGGFKINAPVGSSSMPGQRFLKTIDWKDVKLDQDQYVLKCYPVSSLPSTPAGRLATVQDLARAGYIDDQTARRLIDFPDLQQVQTLLGAAEDWIMKILDGIVEKGKFLPPDPKMNLAMAATMCLQEYSLGAANDMEESKLEQLGNWLDQVQYLSQKAAIAAAPPVPAPGLPAGALPPGAGVPGPAPVSPLLPPAGTAPVAAAA
jgi:hypothetical protein